MDEMRLLSRMRRWDSEPEKDSFGKEGEGRRAHGM